MSVLLETSEGDIVIDLLVDHAPKLCENFLKLCKVKYYNFSPVHTVKTNSFFQTGDPLGPLSDKSDGGSSIWGHLSGDTSRRTFAAPFHPQLKHSERGTVSMATTPLSSDPDTRVAASQFTITLGEATDLLDGQAAIFGKVAEGFDTLDKINNAMVDKKGYPFIDIRINHTFVLDDPFPDPPELREPSASPPPTDEQLKTVRIANEAELHEDDHLGEEELEERRRKREAHGNAVMLEFLNDLPFAEVQPPENELFVCKLNPITEAEDLEPIFARFGKILSCKIVRDYKTGDSLQYGFIEFEDKAACEAAFHKMQGVLIDDRRIHVDFSQSIWKMWRKDDSGNWKKRDENGNWTRWNGLKEDSQQRRPPRGEEGGNSSAGKYKMLYGEEEMKGRHERNSRRPRNRSRNRSRSRSPQRRRSRERHHRPRDSDRGHHDRRDGDRHRDRRNDDSYGSRR